MTTWKITNRLTGEVVHAYTSDEPVDWPDMEFARFNHVAVVEVVPTPTSRRLTKLAYMLRFTDAELAAIYDAAKTYTAIEIWLAKFNAATPDPDGTSVDLDDEMTIGGLQVLEAKGLLGIGRAAEIVA